MTFSQILSMFQKFIIKSNSFDIVRKYFKLTQRNLSIETSYFLNILNMSISLKNRNETSHVNFEKRENYDIY